MAPSRGVMRTRALTFLLLLFALLIVSCRAEEPAVPAAESESELKRNIAALGSDEFEESEQAGRELIKADERAEERGRAALQSRDAEVSMRAARILEQITYNKIDRTELAWL